MDPAVVISWSSVLTAGFYSRPSKNSTTYIRKRNTYVCVYKTCCLYLCFCLACGDVLLVLDVYLISCVVYCCFCLFSFIVRSHLASVIRVLLRAIPDGL